ncbi:hypothetical protein SAMN05216353_11133, partial [Halobacillus alkaliphilus]
IEVADGAIEVADDPIEVTHDAIMPLQRETTLFQQATPRFRSKHDPIR